MSYAVSFQARYVEKRSRLSTFFRLLLAIPLYFVAALWWIVASFTLFAAWFALLFTGRYPAGLYELNCGLLRMNARVMSYAFLLTDPYPVFGRGINPEYPVHLVIAPAQQRYSRLKVLFRMFLAIPIVIVNSVFAYGIEAVAFVSWFAVVLLGRMPRGLHNALEFLIGYNVRASAYLWLITESYPPFHDEGPGPMLEPGPHGVSPLPVAR